MRLFTAPEVAEMCGVDAKTVHCWVAKGRLSAGRTPGRHLRIRAAEVRRLLGQMGAREPEEVARACEADGAT